MWVRVAVAVGKGVLVAVPVFAAAMAEVAAAWGEACAKAGPRPGSGVASAAVVCANVVGVPATLSLPVLVVRLPAKTIKALPTPRMRISSAQITTTARTEREGI